MIHGIIFLLNILANFIVEIFIVIVCLPSALLQALAKKSDIKPNKNLQLVFILLTITWIVFWIFIFLISISNTPERITEWQIL